MSVKKSRNEAIERSILRIRKILNDGVSVPALEQAKLELMELCAKAHLFPRTDFPVPTGDLTERTFLVHEDDNGEYALYVNSGGPGQTSEPHNHGGSWAIIAAIEGEETHKLYSDEGSNPDSGVAAIRRAAEITVKPGTAVSMMPEGIHSIHAGDQPLLHLHLYGRGYAAQMERMAFDLEAGSVRRFMLEDVGFVEDAR